MATCPVVVQKGNHTLPCPAIVGQLLMCGAVDLEDIVDLAKVMNNNIHHPIKIGALLPRDGETEDSHSFHWNHSGGLMVCVRVHSGLLLFLSDDHRLVGDSDF
jgi:hypothetical protein